MNNNKGEGNVKVIIGIVLLLIIAGAIAYFLKGCNGLGFGNGNGIGIGQQSSNTDSESKDKDENNSTDTASSTDNSSENSSSKNSNEIVIKISEDKVYFDDTVVKDETELKKKIEETSSNDMKYILVEDNPILGTYNWVINVLDELKIEYSSSSTVDK